MHRFFEAQPLYINQKLYLNLNNSHKINSVLKIKINQKIILFNDTNYEFIAQISKVSSKLIEVVILGSKFKDLSSPIQIHLAQAIAKYDNMDWIIQKSVELGVAEITPVITDRTIVKPKDPEKKLLHWQAIAIAACCQCGRNTIPKINPIIYLPDFLNKFSQLENYKFILSPIDNHAQEQTLSRLPKNLALNKEILLLIGPEGGFNKDELHLANTHYFSHLQLGPRILRTETAAIAIISILQANFGDL